MDEVEPQELRRRLDAEEDWLVLDVREDWERAIVSLPGTLNIPLGELAARAGELPSERPVAVMCHSGGRSARAAEWLAAQGRERVYNLAGGIDRWALEVDPSLARY